MLGKRIRRTTSVSNLGPGGAPTAAAGAMSTDEAQITPLSHSAPPSAGRPSILHEQDDFQRADKGYGDASMAVPMSAGPYVDTQRPACNGAIVYEDANMEGSEEGWEGSYACCGDASMQKLGAGDGDEGGSMQFMHAHASMMSYFQEHSPGLLMPYHMGLWITQNNMHASNGHGSLKLDQPHILPVDFLDVCFYCKKRLKHERDIFIYRGDTAFCSEECRHRQIVIDERRSTKANGSSKRGGARANSSSSETAVAA